MKSTLKKKYLVVKHNTLNELRPKDMDLQELRFFTIYLSRINPADNSTRIVRFPLIDFQVIMGFNSRLHIAYLRNVIDGLLTKITGTFTPAGGFVRFQIFKKCVVDKDENGEWYVEFDAHDDALPLMFDLRGHYFKYELWNALRLKSKNQLRMYEILKQYERMGYRIISINELKGQLGLDDDDYSKYNDFKRDVLEVCRKALTENTDISYTYEPYGKKGRGGKILQLKFTITKNKDFVDPLSLSKFIKIDNTCKVDADDGDDDFHYTNKNITPNSKIDLSDIDESGVVRSTGNSWIYEERIDFLMGACNNEFSREEMIVIYSTVQQKFPYIHQDANKSHDFLQHKYREFILNSKKSKISNKFAYFKKLVELG